MSSSYLKQQDRIVNLRNLIDELELDNKFPKLKKGIKDTEPLLEEELDPSTLAISEFYQRQFSVTALNSYKMYNPQLVRDVVVAVRPQQLGGHKLVIDGQHTAGLAIYSGAVGKIKCNVLYHPEDRPLDECIRVEGELFHAYNTARKNPTLIDKYRAGLCFDDYDAVRFHNNLLTCNLQVDGLGDLDGDSLASSGAARFDKCVKQFDNKDVDYKSEIVRAVNYIRSTWGTPPKTSVKDDQGNEIVTRFKYRDDLIHGLTTLLVLIRVGRDKNCKKLTHQQRVDFQEWLTTEAPKKAIQFYTANTAGGNTHYKIAHRFLQEYNTHDALEEISNQWAHENGVWDDECLRETDPMRRAILISNPETRKVKLGKVENGLYRTAEFPRYNA